MLREGAHASYIGSEAEGLEVGDRCLVLSTEPRHAHVRWVTGVRKDTYEAVLNTDLVADRAPARFEDEFTFETFSGRLVNVACLDLLDRSGDEALLRAVAQEGHVEELGEAAHEAVEHLREAIRRDPAWSEISEDLGERAVPFEQYALRHLLMAALQGVGDGTDS